MGRVVLLLIASLALGACSTVGPDAGVSASEATQPPSAPANAASATADDPCQLLTDGEIQRYTSHPLLKRESGTGLRGRDCTWVLNTGSDLDVAGIHSISIETVPTGGREIFDALAGLPSLAGIGDGAVEQGGNTGGDIWAVTGDSLLHLTYALPADVVDADPIVVPLVKLAVSRL